MLRALLIEDETALRADLRAKLGRHAAEITVVGEAATIRAARALLAAPDYDVVFLDVQLVGGNSFDLVPEVKPGARIVFVTAYEAYAVRAFEINALDYLLKPVTSARLAVALQRVASAPPFYPAADSTPPVARPGSEEEALAGPALRIEDTVYLRTGLHARFVPVARISLIVSRENYSEVHLADGTRVFLRKSLKAWEDTLPATHFMRVHRTQIVNLARVKSYQRDGDEHTVLLVDGVAEPVPASRYRWSELRERLAAIRPAL
ncbi:LytR/AlgR family response regulator transcription factor [Oleiharenicola lentus]|uniref:LytR/AlgR family response regulator transcription factor n=1 Tax=Oleiharenicola lentus TaxID=2508720 RepID=UPI003F667D17